MTITFILAADENNAIGYQNKLLCHLPNDLKFFKKTTVGHAVLMGRKTFESIGKALPNRTNIILTRDQNFHAEGVLICHDLTAALQAAERMEESELFVIGGGELYRLLFPMADKIYLTRIHAKFMADTYFPELGDEWQEISKLHFEADETNKYSHDILTFVRMSN